MYNMWMYPFIIQVAETLLTNIAVLKADCSRIRLSESIVAH